MLSILCHDFQSWESGGMMGKIFPQNSYSNGGAKQGNKSTTSTVLGIDNMVEIGTFDF